MRYNKIYILTPDHTESGGIESIYQLADTINRNGGDAINIFQNVDGEPIPERYRHYNLRYSDSFEDSEDNLFIVPEIWTSNLDTIYRCKKAIWWLSVQHNWGKFQDFGNENVHHYCQSYYAQHYLQALNCYRSVMLNDFVCIDFSLNTLKKENIVCYNPAKGLDVTQEIIELNKNIDFVPIVGMTRLETIDLLSRSKVYIDFGNHPGRDRLPREAAILNNCIITNLVGSARYYGDIPIASCYKMANIEAIGVILNDCLLRYQDRIYDFEEYRRVILSQKQEMEMIIKRIFI